MDKQTLMELVRQKDFLYNLSNKHYKDTILRNKAWMEIAEELGVEDVKEVKNEWKKIRDNFRDAIKRQNTTKNGQGTNKLQKYRYYEQLKFLLPFLTSKSENSVISLPCTSSAPSPQIGSDCESECEEPIPVSDSDSDEHPTKKRSVASPKDVLSFLQEMQASREERARKRDEERLMILNRKEHPIDIFMKQIAETVKQFPDKDQLQVKKAIFDIVYEKEEEIMLKSEHDI